MLIAVYGTLMSHSGSIRSGLLSKHAELVGPCEIRGDLYSVGSAFPALRPGDGVVKGELWRTDNPYATASLLRMTDGIEGYRPEDPEHSMYRRVAVQLIEPDVVAWTYVWNREPDRHLTRIPSGDWRAWSEGEEAVCA